jgi:hypothetical protein
MPSALAKHLDFVSASERAELFGSIAAAAAYPVGHPVREGVIKGPHPYAPFLLSQVADLTSCSVR